MKFAITLIISAAVFPAFEAPHTRGLPPTGPNENKIIDVKIHRKFYGIKKAGEQQVYPYGTFDVRVELGRKVISFIDPELVTPIPNDKLIDFKNHNVYAVVRADNSIYGELPDGSQGELERIRRGTILARVKGGRECQLAKYEKGFHMLKDDHQFQI